MSVSTKHVCIVLLTSPPPSPPFFLTAAGGGGGGGDRHFSLTFLAGGAANVQMNILGWIRPDEVTTFVCQVTSYRTIEGKRISYRDQISHKEWTVNK